MQGELFCPDCGRRYYIRGGILADRPLPEGPRRNTAEISGMIEEYVRKNDPDYVMSIRELYQKCAELAETNSREAADILISGESSCFWSAPFFDPCPGRPGCLCIFVRM